MTKQQRNYVFQKFQEHIQHEPSLKKGGKKYLEKQAAFFAGAMAAWCSEIDVTENLCRHDDEKSKRELYGKAIPPMWFIAILRGQVIESETSSNPAADERSERLHMLKELREKDLGAYVKEINETCEEVSYPGGTTALYDDVTDTYYNRAGQKLKRPEDYHPDNDGRCY